MFFSLQVIVVVWDERTSNDFIPGGFMGTHDEETFNYFADSAVQCFKHPRHQVTQAPFTQVQCIAHARHQPIQLQCFTHIRHQLTQVQCITYVRCQAIQLQCFTHVRQQVTQVQCFTRLGHQVTQEHARHLLTQPLQRQTS